MLSRVLLATLVLVLSAGCASDNVDGDPPASPGGSATSSPATPGASTSEPPATPSEPPVPDVVPADGPKLTFSNLDQKVLTLKLPNDMWQATGDESSILSTRSGKTYFIDGFANTLVEDADMGAYLRSQKEIYTARGQSPKRGEDRTVDGIEGVTLQESGKDGLFFQYGAQNGTALLTLRFEFPTDTPKDRAWVESVLASAEWL